MSAASPVYAQSSDEAVGLDDVIVTARRNEEPARKAPVALEVVSGESIDAAGVADLQDLQRQVASLQTSQVSQDEALVSIRGQGPGVGAFPGVVTYFADAPFRGLGQGQMFDLASVQVLKGPQGTLFGRNSNGGAVLFTPRAPGEAASAYLSVEAGDYDARGLRGAIEAPLADGTLAVRAAAMAERRDGFTRVAGSDLTLDDQDVSGGRLTVRWTPTDRVRNDLTIDGSRVRTNGASAILIGLNPNGPLAQFPPQSGIAQAAAGLLAQQAALGPRTQVGLSVDPIHEVDHWGVNDRFEAELGGGWTFTNIASWRRYRRVFRTDYDGTPLQLVDYSVSAANWQTDETQITEEAQLRGQVGGALVTLGAYHQQNEAADDEQQIGVLFYQPTLRVDRADDRSQALYGEARWDASRWLDGLSLSAGYRHTWDRRRQTAGTANLATGTCGSLGAMPPSCLLSGEAEFDAANWSLAAVWSATPDISVYATTRRGYKSGGLNLGQPFAERRSYAPEYLTDVEIGVKGRARLGEAATLTYAIDAYRGDYEDIQVNALVIDGSGFYNIVENGAAATIQGVELDTALSLGPIDLRLAYAYTDARYDDYVSSIYGDLSDADWPYTSRHKGVVGAAWRAPGRDGIGWPVVSLDYAFQSKSTFGYEPDPATREDGYGLLNARLEVRDLAGRPVDLTVFANNLTDKVYRAGVIGLYNTAGIDSAVYGAPRMVSVRLTARFGAEAR